MSEERIEVLKLVADAVIGVDEAERLLRALDDGERARSETRRPGRAPADPRRVGGVAGAFGGMSEALGAMGELVESTVIDAMEGVALWWDEEDVGEPLPLGEFVIPDGERLWIRQHGRPGFGPAVLTLLPADNECCTIEATGASPDVRARRDDGVTRIRWGSGRLTVRVPPAVAHLEARVFGGDLIAFDLGCPVDARTMGGRLELGTRMPFDVRTAGGELVLRVAPGLHGVSRASSMGGSVTIVVPDGLGARIEAACAGGEVRVEPGMGQIRRAGPHLHRKTVIEVRPEVRDPAEITVKTMGGDVVVQRELI